MERPTAGPSSFLGGTVRLEQGRVTIVDAPGLRSAHVDALAREAVCGHGQTRDHARWLVWEIAQAAGVRPASLHQLYAAHVRGELGPVTVPAIRVRGLLYEGARAILRAAVRCDARAFALELARSQVADADQRPAEFATVVLAAAIREGYAGALFLQGNHLGPDAAHHAADPRGQVAAMKQLAQEAIATGVYNIHLDTSMLVDAGHEAAAGRQRPGIDAAADVLCYLREIEPPATTICVGGQVRGTGAWQVATVDAVRAFASGLEGALRSRAPAGTLGIAKVAVPGGLASGAATLDAKLLGELARALREAHGLALAVHSAGNALHPEHYRQLSHAGVAEVGLALGAEATLLALLPRELRERMERWSEAQPLESEPLAVGHAEAQVAPSARRALGAFKRELWDLPPDVVSLYAAEIEAPVDDLMRDLGVAGTAEVVARYVDAPEHHRRAPLAPPSAPSR